LPGLGAELELMTVVISMTTSTEGPGDQTLVGKEDDVEVLVVVRAVETQLQANILEKIPRVIRQVVAPDTMVEAKEQKAIFALAEAAAVTQTLVQ
jgi:hypothetical protein